MILQHLYHRNVSLFQHIFNGANSVSRFLFQICSRVRVDLRSETLYFANMGSTEVCEFSLKSV